MQYEEHATDNWDENMVGKVDRISMRTGEADKAKKRRDGGRQKERWMIMWRRKKTIARDEELQQERERERKERKKERNREREIL